jgi:protein CpxP
MKRTRLAVIVAVFMAMIATSVFAFSHGRGPGYGPCTRGDLHNGKRMSELNLTAEQTAKIKEIRDAQWKEIRALQKLTFAKRDEIRKLWLEPSPDEAKIMAAQKEMRVLRDQIEDQTTGFRLKAAKVLTAEQRGKIGSFNWGRNPIQRRVLGQRQGPGPGIPGEECCFGNPARQ